MQLIVLGMHRSGTSAVARLLNLMGAYFAPAELAMPANENNQKGYWERWDIFGLHEDMLRELGWAWDRISSFESQRLLKPDFIAQFRPRAERVLLDIDARRPWMLKDPRLNLLLPFWEPLLEVPVCIHVYRSPVQIAQSLQNREGFPISLGLALWEQYSLLGLAHSEAIPRLLISYHNLMTNPVETVSSLYTQLVELKVQGLRLPSVREIQAFIEPRLYHHQADVSLQKGYANAQQMQLDEAFAAGNILSLTPLPVLSAGSVEILRSHDDRYRLLARLGHLHHRRQQVVKLLHARRTFNKEQQYHRQVAEDRLQVAEDRIAVLEQSAEERQTQLENQILLLNNWLVALASNIKALFGSYTWRTGSLLTRVALFFLRQKPNPGAHNHILQILEDIDGRRQSHVSLNQSHAVTPIGNQGKFVSTTLERYTQFPLLTLPSVSDYKKWYSSHCCKLDELDQQQREVKGWPEQPLISLVIPCYNSSSAWLDALLVSIHQQTYPGWQCILVDDASVHSTHLAVIDRWVKRDQRFQLIQHECNQGTGGACQTGLEAAQGEYFAVIDHDDLLELNALYEVAKKISECRPDVIYSDELLIRPNGQIIRCEFRPQFNYHFLLSHPYIVHLTVFRRDLLLQVGGFNRGLQISQDYDLLLRIAAATQDFHHIPKVLYRWRIHSSSTGYQKIGEVTKNSLEALNQHLKLVGFTEDEALAVEGLSFNFFRMRYKISPATVSVIIPTRDQTNLLRTCIESLLTKTRLPVGIRLELLVANNNSSEPSTLEYLHELEKQGHRVMEVPGVFNFSRINNLAVTDSNGSLLLFLNNDIEIVEPDWLEAMLEPMFWDDVGIVGAKLIYPSIGLVQHAGVIIGCNGAATHDHQFYKEYENTQLAPGHLHTMLGIRECMAVTAACMLVKREAFDKVGGFDIDLQVGFGDTDLCLRLRQVGYRCLFTPHARLIHHESATRGYDLVDSHPLDTKLFKERWAKQLESGDLYYNPNLSQESGKLFKLNPR